MSVKPPDGSGQRPQPTPPPKKNSFFDKITSLFRKKDQEILRTDPKPPGINTIRGAVLNHIIRGDGKGFGEVNVDGRIISYTVDQLGKELIVRDENGQVLPFEQEHYDIIAKSLLASAPASSVTSTQQEVTEFQQLLETKLTEKRLESDFPYTIQGDTLLVDLGEGKSVFLQLNNREEKVEILAVEGSKIPPQSLNIPPQLTKDLLEARTLINQIAFNSLVYHAENAVQTEGVLGQASSTNIFDQNGEFKFSINQILWRQIKSPKGLQGVLSKNGDTFVLKVLYKDQPVQFTQGYDIQKIPNLRDLDYKFSQPLSPRQMETLQPILKRESFLSRPPTDFYSEIVNAFEKGQINQNPILDLNVTYQGFLYSLKQENGGFAVTVFKDNMYGLERTIHIPAESEYATRLKEILSQKNVAVSTSEPQSDTQLVEEKAMKIFKEVDETFKGPLTPELFDKLRKDYARNWHPSKTTSSTLDPAVLKQRGIYAAELVHLYQVFIGNESLSDSDKSQLLRERENYTQ